MRIADLRSKWTARLEAWEPLGVALNGVLVAREVLADLESLERSEESDIISVSQGARESGYSADHLRRLIREGKIQNLGRLHAPRIRRIDLPKKGRGISHSAPWLYDAAVDARDLAGRQGVR